jgi:AmiR/NasT family two-component response regulator
MKITPNYVLILARKSDDLAPLKFLLRRLSYSVTVATSEEQAISEVMQSIPCLVILTGSHCAWSQSFVATLRGSTHAYGTTIVALTDCHAPSWLPQEENPGLDGFLVKPISIDILSSLVQSAFVKQLCCSTSCT